MTPPGDRLPRYRDLRQNMLQFCRMLRDRDLLVTTSEVLDALRSARSIDLGDRDELRLALRCVLTARNEDLPVFDRTFEDFWGPGPGPRSEESPRSDPSLHRPPTGRPEGPSLTQMVEAQSHEDDRPAQERPSASPQEALARRDFKGFRADEMEEITDAILAVARKLAAQESRRYGSARRGRIIDLRRSVRRSLTYGGTMIELARKRRRIRKTKVVVICDVSRSMEVYSRFMLLFTHALQNSLRRVESFVFSTRLTRVTAYFKREDIYTAVERIAEEVPDWSGGTRIGQSLRGFNEKWAPRSVDKRTTLLIVSDGLDTGDVGTLQQEMRSLRRRARSVIWLNPLLGSADYRALARGMSAALPYIDVFATAHDLESLRALGRHLTARRSGPS